MGVNLLNNKFFGVALDPDDTSRKLAIKHAYLNALLAGTVPYPDFLDPYDALTYSLQDLFMSPCFIKTGRVLVDSWLTPKPKVEDVLLVNADNYAAFVDSGGCGAYEEIVKHFVMKKIFPERPIMFGVDHSSTGGVLKALSKEYGSENITMIILDSHFDASYTKMRMDLFEYAKEKGTPEILGISPLIEDVSILEQEVPESYNCGSFLRYLIDEAVILPENLKVIGVSDYPNEKMRKINDHRVKNYVELYESFEDKGVTFAPKETFKRIGVTRALKPILNEMEKTHVYISLDVDIGSLNGVYAARFMNVIGLSLEDIYEISRLIKQALKQQKLLLLGFDIMEIDVHLAGAQLKDGTIDKTYEMADNFVRFLLDEKIRVPKSN